MVHVCKQSKERLSHLLSTAFFKALADPNRIALLTRLVEYGGERTVGEMADCCPVDFSVVSRHLRTLKDAGIIAATKRGKEVFYRVRITELTAFLRGLADALEKCCPDGECTFCGEKNGK